MTVRLTTPVEGLPPLEVVAALDGEALLVDVRVTGGVGQAVIPGGVQIRAVDLAAAAQHDPMSTGDTALSADLRLDRGQRIILYCDDGGQSSRTAATLFELGYEQVTYLLGGVAAWIADGLDVELPTLAGSNLTNEKEHES